ncbi:MAG: hypothetical protein IPP55_14615 [Anaerolineales bacterium]|nr:hypothetical protein [Anaerolineales bacterium]
MKDQETSESGKLPNELRLVKLTREQVKRIDELLAELGEYGELHIIIERGDLRYINKVESYKFWDTNKRK